MLNLATFLFKRDAELNIQLLIPRHASKAKIHLGEDGYWINVWWNSGITAPLTIQELNQAEEISNVESPRVS